MDYGIKILNDLISKYEKSKTFAGINKVGQQFCIDPRNIFRAYGDHSNYETFDKINDSLMGIEHLGYVTIERSGAVVDKVKLNIDRVQDIYEYLKRTPKHEVQNKLQNLFDRFEGKHEMMDEYIAAQREKLKGNKKIREFKGDLIDYEDILKGLTALLELEVETYERDFSVRLYSDSKRFKTVESRIVSIIYEYGEFPNKEGILGELNLLKNPTYVHMKGAGSITFGEQSLNLEVLPADIALSSENLFQISSVDISGTVVMTIENLTTFHRFNEKNVFAIYLGGFHNNAKRTLLKKIHSQNPEIAYLHFGDIDIGGIYIYEHLKKKTMIPFIPYMMNREVLFKHNDFTQSLTENDKRRAKGLMDTHWHDLLEYMLDRNCKLEQEAIEDFEDVQLRLGIDFPNDRHLG